jgi:hypothetical protein
MKRKYVAVGIMLLFVGMGTISSTAHARENVVPSLKNNGVLIDVSKQDDVNWTINGTMGDNGWYISPILVACTYDDELIAAIYYDYGEGWQMYTEQFIIDLEGQITLTWYAVDYQGNAGAQETLPPFKIDDTSPVVELHIERTGLTRWLISVDGSDKISGIVLIEVYWDNLLIGNITTAPYKFEFSGYGNHTVKVIGYDAAGNNESDSGYTTKSNSCIQSQAISTLQPLNQRRLIITRLCM